MKRVPHKTWAQRFVNTLIRFTFLAAIVAAPLFRSPLYSKDGILRTAGDACLTLLDSLAMLLAPYPNREPSNSRSHVNEARNPLSIASTAEIETNLEILKRFTQLSEKTWEVMREPITLKLSEFRILPKGEQRKLLEEQARLLHQRVGGRLRSQNYGLHYNMHGGRAEEYIGGGGIRASLGNVLRYTMASMERVPNSDAMKNLNEKPNVFYYRATGTGLGKFLAGNFSSGSVLMIFDVDSVRQMQGVDDDQGFEGSAFAFDKSSPFSGVPTSAFLLPPLQIIGDSEILERFGQTPNRGRLARYFSGNSLSNEDIQFVRSLHLLALLEHPEIETFQLR